LQAVVEEAVLRADRPRVDELGFVLFLSEGGVEAAGTESGLEAGVEQVVGRKIVFDRRSPGDFLVARGPIDHGRGVDPQRLRTGHAERAIRKRAVRAGSSKRTGGRKAARRK